MLTGQLKKRFDNFNISQNSADIARDAGDVFPKREYLPQLIDWLEFDWFYPEGITPKEIITNSSGISVITNKYLLKFFNQPLSQNEVPYFFKKWQDLINEKQLSSLYSANTFLGIFLIKWEEGEPRITSFLPKGLIKESSIPGDVHDFAIVYKLLPQKMSLTAISKRNGSISMDKLKSLYQQILIVQESKMLLGQEKERKTENFKNIYEEISWLKIEKIKSFRDFELDILDDFSKQMFLALVEELISKYSSLSRQIQERAREAEFTFGFSEFYPENINFYLKEIKIASDKDCYVDSLDPYYEVSAMLALSLVVSTSANFEQIVKVFLETLQQKKYLLSKLNFEEEKEVINFYLLLQLLDYFVKEKDSRKKNTILVNTFRLYFLRADKFCFLFNKKNALISNKLQNIFVNLLESRNVSEISYNEWESLDFKINKILSDSLSANMIFVVDDGLEFDKVESLKNRLSSNGISTLCFFSYEHELVDVLDNFNFLKVTSLENFKTGFFG